MDTIRYAYYSVHRVIGISISGFIIKFTLLLFFVHKTIPKYEFLLCVCVCVCVFLHLSSSQTHIT